MPSVLAVTAEPMPSPMRVIAGRKRMPRFVVEGKRGETVEVPQDSGGILVTGCTDCTINAPGKSCNVTIERCKGMTVRVGSVRASLEIIQSTAVDVSAMRCRTITVDTSKNVNLSSMCQQPYSEGQQAGKTEVLVDPNTVADEASAIRLFTSSSDGIVITFQGIMSMPDENGSGGPMTYRVPKDFIYEEGDGPRSVSRVTIDRGGEGRGACKTLRCDQFGTPLEQVEAATAGVEWTWEHGRTGALVDRAVLLIK